MEPDDDDHQQQQQQQPDDREDDDVGQNDDLNADGDDEDQQLHHDVAMNDVYEETFDPDEVNMTDDSDIAANLLVSTSSHIY